MNRFLGFPLGKTTKPRIAKEIIEYQQKYLEEKYSSLKNVDFLRSILAESILLFRFLRESIIFYSVQIRFKNRLFLKNRTPLG